MTAPEAGRPAAREVVDRNVLVDDLSAAACWPFEAVLSAVDRGSLADWRRLAAEVRRAPWGPVADAVSTICGWEEHPGIDAVLADVVARARAEHPDPGGAQDGPPGPP